MTLTPRQLIPIVLTACACASAPADAQTFALFVSRVHASPEPLRTALIDSFIRAVPSFPFVENDSTVHFLYRGSASSVSVPGDANTWSADGVPMQRLSTTDLWYRTERYEPDARLDYKFIVNGTWILDPRNPRTVTGGYGPNSELRMPRYREAPEIVFDPAIPHGTMIDTTITSAALGNARLVRTYLPPGYERGTERYPVAVFHDGLEYLSLAQANNTLDFLIARKEIVPVIAVFIPPVNRTAEYAGTQMAAFASFIIDDVLGYVDRRFRTRSEASSRATIGASNGGNISLYLAAMHPDRFGNAAGQSSNIQRPIADRFAGDPRLPVRVSLDVGTYDIPVLIPMARSFVPVLASKGYQYRYTEYHEGHSWGNWRAHLDDALVFFFGSGTTEDESKSALPSRIRLDQNFPNPFPEYTTIPVTLGGADSGAIRIRDVSGTEVAAVDIHAGPGRDMLVRWNARGIPAGVYICELESGGATARRILVKL